MTVWGEVFWNCLKCSITGVLFAEKNEHDTHNITRPVTSSQLPALLASPTQLSSSASENDRQQVKVTKREVSNKMPTSHSSVKITPHRRMLLNGEPTDMEMSRASAVNDNSTSPQRLSLAYTISNCDYRRKENLSSCARSQCQYYQPLETNLNPYLPHIHNQIPFHSELRLQAVAGDNGASKCDLGSLQRPHFSPQGRYELTAADYHDYVKAIHGHGYGQVDNDKFVKDHKKSSY